MPPLMVHVLVPSGQLSGTSNMTDIQCFMLPSPLPPTASHSWIRIISGTEGNCAKWCQSLDKRRAALAVPEETSAHSQNSTSTTGVAIKRNPTTTTECTTQHGLSSGFVKPVTYNTLHLKPLVTAKKALHRLYYGIQLTPKPTKYPKT